MKYDDVPFNPGYGVEPPRFAGRELVAQTILLGLQRGPGREEFLNIVTGGRGTGKTTLLNHLRRYVTSEWGWSTMKWAGRPSWPLTQLLAEEAPRIEHELRSPLQKVRSALRPDSISARTPVGTITKNTEPNASLPRSVTATLRQLGQLAEHNNRTIVLFVDELQAVSADDLAELSGTLQIVTNEEVLPVAVVAAGLPSTRKVIGSIPGTTFIERQDEHRLGNLSVDAARDALETPILAAGRRIDNDALERLVEASKGYPYAVQLAGKYTWIAAGESDDINLRHAVAGIAGMTEKLEQNLYETRWDNLTTNERSYVLAASEIGDTDIPTLAIVTALGRTQAAMSTVRDGLINDRHLMRAGKHGHISFDIPGFADWVRDNRSSVEHVPHAPNLELPVGQV